MVRKLLYLNGLAILGAVLYHASGWGYVAMFWWTDRYRAVSVPNFDAFGGPQYFLLRIIEQVIIFAIPAFLFVSGFFTAAATGRNRDTIAANVIASRIRNLFVPYFVWSCVIMLLDWLTGRVFTPLKLVEAILTGKAAEPFYFIPALIQLYLLARWIIPAAKNRPKLLIAFAAALLLLTDLIYYDRVLDRNTPLLASFQVLAQSWLFPRHLLWFGLGAVFGFHQLAIKPVLAAARRGLLAALALVFLLGMVEWEAILRQSGQDWIAPSETLVDQVFALLFLCVFIAYEHMRLPWMKPVEKLGARSMGVFLVHSLALVYTARLIAAFLPQLLSAQVLFQPILYLAGLGIPLGLMWILDHSPVRRFYSYVFG